jgi:hypothetical protein
MTVAEHLLTNLAVVACGSLFWAGVVLAARRVRRARWRHYRNLVANAVKEEGDALDKP